MAVTPPVTRRSSFSPYLMCKAAEMAIGVRYPVGDLDAAMDAVLARVRADTGDVGPGPSLAVDPTFGDPDDAPAHHVVVRIEGNTTLVGFGTGLESACAEAMSVVQDAVVESLRRPWPEVDDVGGVGVGVLDVALEPSGIAHWALRGEPICPVGQLVPTCRALGWRIR